MEIYCINLDRDPERMAGIRRQFEAVGMAGDLLRFAAIDARAGGFHAPGHAPHSWRDRWELKPSEQAVFESHRAIWQHVADGSAQGAVICEDDILVSRRFPEAVGALDLARFGVVKLDGFDASSHYGPEHEMNGWKVRPVRQAVPSAACYALSQTAARKLLKDSGRYCETLDDFVFRARPGLHPVQLFPGVAVQGVCVAEAQAAPQEDSSRISAREAEDRAGAVRRSKGPAAYRLYKELRRNLRKLRLSIGEGVICRPPLADDLPPYAR
ncbi:MAG: glycosyltransferase family 25 protein [Paracoccaceae bacterium]